MSKQRRLVLVVSMSGLVRGVPDGGGLPAQQWIVDAYLLTLGSLILIAGSLSDLLGRKKILMTGLIGFGVASLLCAAAPTSTALIIFRALQGIAGALLVPSSLAIIISTFSGPAQGKAVGTWTAWTGISFVVGPLLGGFLVDAASWRWIFAINVVPIAVTLYLLRRVKISEDGNSHAKVDFLGALLCALGLGGPVFALIEQPRYGWSDPLIYLPLAIGAILFISFLIYESRARHPMLKLNLFKNRNFSVGNVATLAIYAGLSVSTFLIVLFLQQVSGYSALHAGMALLPVTIVMFLLSPRFGALSAKYGPRFFMGVGPLIAGLGFLLVGRLPLGFNYWTHLLPGIIVFGLGLSMTVAPLTEAILGDVPQKEAGIASAVNNAVARIAGLLAVAAVGAIVALQFGNTLDKLCTTAPAGALTKAKQASLVTTPPKPYQNDVSFKIALEDASVSAFHAGMDVTAGLVITGGIISLIGIKNPSRPVKADAGA